MTTVHVDTSQFEFSHGRKPRGAGSWAFDFGTRGNWQTRFAPGQMSFSKAKQWAMAQAVEMNVSTVCVAP